MSLTINSEQEAEWICSFPSSASALASFNSTAIGFNLKMPRIYEHFLSRKSLLILPVISRILFNSRFVELYSLSHLLDASLLGVGNECLLTSTVLLALHTSKMQWGANSFTFSRLSSEKKSQINSSITNVNREHYFASHFDVLYLLYVTMHL